MALVNYLEIPIKIVYLDGNIKKEIADEMVFPETYGQK